MSHFSSIILPFLPIRFEIVIVTHERYLFPTRSFDDAPIWRSSMLKSARSDALSHLHFSRFFGILEVKLISTLWTSSRRYQRNDEKTQKLWHYDRRVRRLAFPPLFEGRQQGERFLVWNTHQPGWEYLSFPWRFSNACGVVAQNVEGVLPPITINMCRAIVGP